MIVKGFGNTGKYYSIYKYYELFIKIKEIVLLLKYR